MSLSNISSKAQEILTCLGVDAVLLPIKAGTKAPLRGKWQQVTFGKSTAPTYQDMLSKAPAIGVLLGDPSQGLCSIDIDIDEAVDEFLTANPMLRKTLRTKGKRGANLWVQIAGPIPLSRNLNRAGKPAGEWRANGRQTVIAGQHPDGGAYSRIVDAVPVCIEFSEINWPWGDFTSDSAPSSVHRGYRATEDVEGTDDAENTDEGRGVGRGEALRRKIMAAEEARTSMEHNPSLKRLYNLFVLKVYTPTQGKRNSDLVSMVTFLYRSVGREMLEGLVMAFYEINQDVFRDSKDQHFKEATAHIEACEQRWLSELTKVERDFVDSLPVRHVEAFRICRDLAMHKGDRCDPDEFFLSCCDLGQRISCSAPEAHRILNTFAVEGILAISVMGTKHSKAAKGKATMYKWTISLVVGILMIAFLRISFLALFWKHQT